MQLEREKENGTREEDRDNRKDNKTCKDKVKRLPKMVCFAVSDRLRIVRVSVS